MHNLNITFLLLFLSSFVHRSSTIGDIFFTFNGGNRAFGPIPQDVKISGYYYIPQNHSIMQLLLSQTIHLGDIADNCLYACSESIERLLGNIQYSEVRKENTLKEIKLGTITDAKQLPLYANVERCSRISTKSFHVNNVFVYKFEFFKRFNTYTPILFVDPFGIAAFLYKQKFHSEQVLTHCPGLQGSKSLVAFNPRPSCPRSAAKKVPTVEGRATLYKPNIMQIQKTAYHCYILEYKIVTVFWFFGSKSDNRPYPKFKRKVDANECRQWINDRRCRDLGTIRNTTATEFVSDNPLEIKYTWPSCEEYSYYQCVIEVGTIRTIAPYNKLTTAWTDLPSSYNFKDSYVFPDTQASIIWEPFRRCDLCNYVPFSSWDVKKITYSSGDFVDEDPHPNTKYIIHFMSETQKGIIVTDNTQEITDWKSFDCIPKTSNERNLELYAIHDGMLILFCNQSRKSLMKQFGSNASIGIDSTLLTNDVEYHPFDSYGRIIMSAEIDDPDNDNAIEIVDSRTVENDISIQSTSGIMQITPTDLPTNFQGKSVDELDNTKFDTTFQDTFSDVTPVSSTVNFIDYKLRELVKAVQTDLSQSICEQQQHIYDLNRYVAESNPSLVITSFLNRPVKAKPVGLGIFEVEECVVIRKYSILDNLFVNNTAKYDSKRTYADIYRLKGIPDYYSSACFSSPLVRFNYDQITDQDIPMIGQVLSDNSISTLKLPNIETCKLDSIFYHTLNNKIHIFHNYLLIKSISTDKLKDHKYKIETTHKLKLSESKKGGNLTRSQQRELELLQKIRFVDLFNKLEARPIAQTSGIGHFNEDIYTYKETRETTFSIMEALSYVTRRQLDNIYIENKRRIEAFSSATDVNLSVIIDDIFQVGETIVEGAGKLFRTGISEAGETVRTGISQVGNTFEKVADFFSGPIFIILVIIACVIAVAVIGYILFKKFLNSNSTGVTKSAIKFVQPQVVDNINQ